MHPALSLGEGRTPLIPSRQIGPSIGSSGLLFKMRVDERVAIVTGGAGGAIVLVSSVGAFAAQEGAGVYCATKAAVSALARGMALEWAELGIRVNAIAPGDILTNTSENVVREARSSGLSGRFVRATPLGRRGSPHEIGDTIAFLASDHASFITGTTLVADGGLLIY